MIKYDEQICIIKQPPAHKWTPIPTPAEYNLTQLEQLQTEGILPTKANLFFFGN
uniref:Uncharacterized protein n=1 Tax=Physcomitrium patens TaxID=3218 RepID=A0A2K1K6Q1_PHYPA|nr:hypothetical protein PHYPA_011344 [Physcomitrium patens]